MIGWILAGTLLIAPFFPKSDPWFAKDKVQHFAVSFVVYSGVEYWGRSQHWKRPEIRGITVTISLGLLKELVDWQIRKTGFSWKDLLYDVAGAVTAAGIH